MSKSALSLFVFGLYLAAVGLGFAFMPNVVLSLLGFPETSEVWIRVVGALALLLAFYYVLAARAELLPFIKWTVYGRIAAFGFFVLVVLVGWGSPMLLLFGGADLLAALWTAWALRADAQYSTEPAVS